MKKFTFIFLMAFIFSSIFPNFSFLKQEKKEFSVNFLFTAPVALAAPADPSCPSCGQCVDCEGAQKTIAEGKKKEDEIFKASENAGKAAQQAANSAYTSCREDIMDALNGIYDKISSMSASASGLLGTAAVALQSAIQSAVEGLIQDTINMVCDTIDTVSKEALDKIFDEMTVDLPYGLGSIGPEGINSSYVDSPWELNVGKYGKLETNSQNVSDSLTKGMIKGGSSALGGALKKGTSGLIKP